MSWWYNKTSGKFSDYTGPIGGVQQFFQQLQTTVGLPSLGWVELPSNITTQAQATAYVKAHYPNDAPPTTSDAQALLQGIPGGSQITSVEQFLTGLTSASLWIRVAKVVIGGTLILVGVAKLTGADSAIGKVARHIPIIPV